MNASSFLNYSLLFISLSLSCFVALNSLDNHLFLDPPNAYGQFLSPYDDKSPAFLDSYWTDNPSAHPSSSDLTNPVRIEVGPGDGPSKLAVILVNTGRSDITGLKGFLGLPPEFRSIKGENNVTHEDTSVASYNAVVKPGETFPLFFTVNVLKNATVGSYVSNLNLLYSKVQETGQISSAMDIPFRVTGKVILDTASITQNLTTGFPNKITIAIKNKGSADASGAVASITNLSGGALTNMDSANSGEENAGVTNNNGNNPKSNDTQSENKSNSSAKLEPSNKQGSNDTGNGNPDLATLQATTFDLGTIHANSLATINPIIYVDYGAGGTIQTVNLQITYNDAYGNRKSQDASIGLIVSPNAPESILSVLPKKPTSETDEDGDDKNIVEANNDNDNKSIIIKSGKIENIRFAVHNNGNEALKDAVVSLSSPSDSVKILGSSRWTFPLFPPNADRELSVLVFASEDMINKPVTFTLDADYVLGGKTRTDSINLGAYIEGQVRVTTYDVSVNEIGGVPNLGGNLLNEGNTMAFFTRVQIVNPNLSDDVPKYSSERMLSSPSPPLEKQVSSQAQMGKSKWQLISNVPPSQYLGDLTENSPLPFSIPINITKNTPGGAYPVSIKVSYQDNLRNAHELILNQTVNYEPAVKDSVNKNQSIFGIDKMVILPVASLAIALIVILVFLLRRRRRRSRRRKDGLFQDAGNSTTGKEDISLLDDGDGVDSAQ
jgi:hypothetical protein